MLLRICLLILISFLAIVHCAPSIRKRDADFESVRTRLSRDHSGKAGDPKDKYFHESTVSVSQPKFMHCGHLLTCHDSFTRITTAGSPIESCLTMTDGHTLRS